MLKPFASILSACAFMLAAPSAAQEESEASEAINARITETFNAELQSLNAMQCTDDDTACLSAELIERYRVDQWARRTLTSGVLCEDYSGQDAENCAGMVMGTVAFQVDMQNTARLKHIITVHGWPAPPVFSEETQNAAWYLAQHAMLFDERQGTLNWDVDFAQSVLPYVREAVEAGQLIPRQYAAMYDRIELYSGRNQRYGTQIACAQGRAHLRGAGEDTDINAARVELGLDPIDRAAYDAVCAESMMPGEA